MKLLFPNGEHAPVELESGRAVLGSGTDADVVLHAPGIAPSHAHLDVKGSTATISLPNPANEVTINGKALTVPAEIKPGDLVTFAGVRVRIVAVEKAASAPPVVKVKEVDVDDDGRTKVRMALPRFVLRGVSGVTFGKVFPLQGTVVIGRQNECEIPIPSEEVSRRHAELRVTPDGIMVEDLGSSNGTYVNDKRITRQLMKAGDELRLDTIRFLLLAPGQEMHQVSAGRADAPAAAAASATGSAKAGGSKTGLMWAIVVVAVLSLAAVGAKIMGVY
ncbi:MAG: FHA domain-containing protein [Lysobacterales bacterium]